MGSWEEKALQCGMCAAHTVPLTSAPNTGPYLPNFEDLLLMLWEAVEQGVPWLWWGQEGNCTPHFRPTRGF